MSFRTMYPPQKDSPTTFLLGDISAVDTLMTVASAAALPQTLPYPLTIGIDKTLTETVMVTAQNLENNQLTVTRGTPAYAWVAGSKVARVLTAKDFKDLQDNVVDLNTGLTEAQETITEHNSDISALKTTVGNAGSGLVKDLADEISRAIDAEGDEVTRATAVEGNLNTIKVNRSELAQVITDWSYSADGSQLLVTITRYNASTQQTSQYTKTIPVATDETMGVMPPEAYAEIESLREDVNTLINLGGRFIGVSFATKAALNAYSVPSSVKDGDFTYVIDDETHSSATTRYVRNGSVWNFTFVIEYDPVGLATTTTAGIVKSKAEIDGKVFVEFDGTMSVIGWSSVFIADNHMSGITNKVFTATEQTKLSGIEAGANNYTHPANHPPSIITQDANNRFVTDTEKTTWNNKATPSYVDQQISQLTVYEVYNSQTAYLVGNRVTHNGSSYTCIQNGTGKTPGVETAYWLLIASKGDTGANGYTPVKGTDYFTAEDKEEIVAEVIQALGGSPVFGYVDENNNILLSGNLADGSYTLKYENEDGTYTEIGTLEVVSPPPAPTYTNLFDPSTASINTRWSSSSGSTSAADGFVASALIDFGESVSIPGIASATEALTLRIRPNGMFHAISECNIQYFNSDGTRFGGGYLQGNTSGITMGTDENGDTYIYLGKQGTSDISGVRYFAIGLKVSDSAITTDDIQDIIITLNEPITD